MTNGARSADQIYDILSQRIAERALAPGASLTETVLASEFGLSRTPVREALHRLAGEGLVERGARRAFFVRRMTAADLSDLFESLGEIEATCARLAALRMTEIERDGLNRMVTEMPRDYARHNSSFHAAIRAGARNQILATLALDLERRSLPWRDASLRASAARVEQSRLEHRAIVEAVRDGDGSRAAKLMRSHMAGSLSTISERLG
ncbi:GntR family transcriptional regulator [Paracoccus ravus]|uniref:GntR family transcriptional regulator n=1 Tax=Paracoccus ravus TaxID=2447760 RepID=UPI00106EC31D|nr:GntR family transcriptional regulator [Paracoccus ravus]